MKKEDKATSVSIDHPAPGDPITSSTVFSGHYTLERSEKVIAQVFCSLKGPMGGPMGGMTGTIGPLPAAIPNPSATSGTWSISIPFNSISGEDYQFVAVLTTGGAPLAIDVVSYTGA